MKYSFLNSRVAEQAAPTGVRDTTLKKISRRSSNPAHRDRDGNQARHEIATTTVGFLIALAFTAMVEAVKDAVKANLLTPQSEHHPINTYRLWETGLIASTFWLTGFGSFFGTQKYLWSPSVEYALAPEWLYNFFGTIVTLTALGFMGATSAFESKFIFVDTLILLCCFRTIWGWLHLAYLFGRRWLTGLPIERESVGWWNLVNPIVAALSFWIYRSDRKLGRETLVWLFSVQLASCLWDTVAATKSWEREIHV